MIANVRAEKLGPVRVVRFESTGGVREVRLGFPGPQGASGGSSASEPADAIYLTCSDGTIHACRVVVDQGYYTLQPDQADSTP